MIDHTRAFKIFKDLKKEEELGNNCMRELLAALRKLDKATLSAEMAGLLTEGQINGVLARRDRIVRYFENKVATLGEGRVFYDLPARQ
jgi:hypothetical protein